MVTKERSLVDIISDYVFTDMQPISTGEKEGFTRMFKELNPEITKISPPPGATPCGERFVENIYTVIHVTLTNVFLGISLK